VTSEVFNLKFEKPILFEPQLNDIPVLATVKFSVFCLTQHPAKRLMDTYQPNASINRLNLHQHFDSQSVLIIRTEPIFYLRKGSDSCLSQIVPNPIAGQVLHSSNCSL
jgi:hypothetical protein